jgi:hypothetical protein
MPELDTQDRSELDDSQFACVDRERERHLPVPDESHTTPLPGSTRPNSGAS